MDDRGQAVTRLIYNVLVIDKDGRKDLLGMYISKNEGANFWLNVLTDLQNCGVQDILIACVDGLRGFDISLNKGVKSKLYIAITRARFNSVFFH